MNNLRRFLSVFISLIMLFGVFGTAFAAPEAGGYAAEPLPVSDAEDASAEDRAFYFEKDEAAPEEPAPADEAETPEEPAEPMREDEPIAEEPVRATYSGTCGDNLSWTLNTSTGVLSITGTGAMYDYTNSNRAPWYDYRSSITSVNIGNGVTGIGSYAFSSCSSLASVTIPSGVTSISDYAFYCCTSLTSVTIPGSVTSIGDYAFYWNTSLASITIPSGVTSIGDYAFYWNTLLAFITIPGSVTSIGNCAFSGCKSVTSIDVAYDNGFYSSIDGVLFNKATTTLIQYPGGRTGSYAIPVGVTRICSYAFFFCASLFSITIPSSVTSIDSYAFHNCSSLSSVTIPDSVTSIVEFTFYECDSLLSIDIGSGVTSIDSYAFSYCPSLAAINVSTENMQYCSCEGVLFNKSLTTLLFCPHAKAGAYAVPESVTRINSRAFAGCIQLTSIDIPQSVINVGSEAFISCDSLVAINVSQENLYYSSLNGVFFNKSRDTLILYPRSKDGGYSIPNTVTKITSYAFSGCNLLTSINVPNGVLEIGYMAFSGCSSLTSVHLPDTITYISFFAFNNCTSIVSINIPKSMTEISSSTFFHCHALESITIPSTINSIGGSAFGYCQSLSSVLFLGAPPQAFGGSSVFVGHPSDFCIYYTPAHASEWAPNGETTWNGYPISRLGGDYSGKCGDNLYWDLYLDSGLLEITGTGAMYSYSSSSSNRAPWYDYRSSITTVNIGNGAASIGKYAFPDCTSLTSVTIPSGVTSIGYRAFDHCTSLASVTIPSSVTSIGEFAFDSCSSLTSVTIPSSVTSIGNYAFEYCSSLASVMIPANVTSIGYAPFCACTSLTAINVASSNPNYKSVGGVLFNKSGTELINYPAGKAGAYTIPAGVTNIGNYAFEYCTSLTSVTIPDGVTSISIGAFSNCSSLASVTIPSGVTSIGKYAFSYCSSLASVTIPSGVTSIGYYAFGSCSSLASVTIPSGVTSIGSYAFYYCSSLASVTIPNSVTSIGDYAFRSCTSLASITIPSGVTSIGDYAFCSCTSLASVTIPDSVTSIGNFAFEYCSSLTSVTIPASVTSIGYAPFADCTSLTAINVASSNPNYKSVGGVLFNKAGTELINYPAGKAGAYTIPSGVTSIGDSAFEYCTSLSSVTIPSGVTSIGNSAFYSCSSLTSVIMPESLTSLGSNVFRYCTSLVSATFLGAPPTRYGSTMFHNCASDFCIYYTADHASEWSPHGETTWNFYPMQNAGDIYSGQCGDNLYWTLFTGSGLLEITGTGAMYSYSSSSSNRAPWYDYRSSITTVNIGNGAASIGNSAFYGCTSLASVTIPNSVTSIGSDAFYNCTSLTSVTIPNSVASIGWYAFCNCTSLTSVTIPGSVTSIGVCAFSYCTSLTSVTIPAGVTSIGSAPFRACTSLTAINVASANPNYKSVNGVLFNKSGTSLINYPAGKTGAYSIPSTVTGIGSEAFSGCTSLTSVTIPNSVASIGFYAFNNCTSLTSVTIPDSVTNIDSAAFNHCTSLTSVTIPGSVTSIGHSAFYYCTSLTSVTIGSGVTSIDTQAFSGCSSLTSVTIPNSVTSIGNSAFSSCTSLVSATFLGAPPSSFGSLVFDYCASNFVIYYTADHASEWAPNGETTWNGYPISRLGGDYSGKCGDNLYWDLYLDSGLLEITGTGAMYDYSSLSSNRAPWYDYRSSITTVNIGNGAASIGNFAFFYCTSLTSVTIPSGVTSIGNSAFADCTSLASVTIPSGVTNIGNCAFSYCASLASVTIPYGVTRIGNCAFEYCASLASITIPNSVTSIGYSAFADCTSLASVTIPSGVTSIGDDAFYSCTSLASVTIPASVTSIGTAPFAGCTSLTAINVAASNPNYKSISGVLFNKSGTELINYPAGKTGAYTIPSGVTSIGESAFEYCTSLSSVTILSGVTSIGNYAFYDCDSLASVTIPSGVTSIGSYAFSYCDSLASVTIPSSVTSISGCAFCCCTSLTSVTIPYGVTSIDYYAFENCTSLASVTIPNSVTSIGGYAFSYCTSLASVTIPNSVTSIGTLAFCNCTSLNSATFLGAPPTSFGSGVFDCCASNFVIYYKGAYASQWAPNGETTWHGYPIRALPHTLTINYVYTDGTTAAPSYTEQIAEGAQYSVTSPAIQGYTPDRAVVSGTMGVSDVTITVTYTRNSHTLRINYKYQNGSQAAPSYTHSYYEGEAYSVTSPTVAGYTPNTAVVSGVMGASDVTIDVIYTQNALPKHTLTINYVYANGSQAAPTHTEQVTEGAQYSVTSPAIQGYTPDIPVVSGTMGQNDIRITVTYTQITHKLTIFYRYNDNSTAAETYTAYYGEGESYSVTSPVIPGFTANRPVVTGVMGTTNRSVIVYYSPITHTLTISYVYENGDEAAPPYTAQIAEGAGYSVTSPTIAGYTPDMAVVSGTMGAEDAEVIVTYSQRTHTLTIYYMYENGDQAAATYIAQIAEGAYYSVVSPVIEGYIPSQEVVSGTMGTSSRSITVVYSVAPLPVHTLTIHYVYADYSAAAPTHTEQVTEGASYYVYSPVITGYTADISVVQGIMGAEDITVTVIYSINVYTVVFFDWNGAVLSEQQVEYGSAAEAPEDPVREGYTFTGWDKDFSCVTSDLTVTARYSVNSYTLTVRYVNENGSNVASSHIETLVYGAAYSVDSPALAGFYPDRDTVSGVMGAGNVTITVVYKPLPTLTIIYRYADGSEAAPTYTAKIRPGEHYRVISPFIMTYSADRPVVDSVMGTDDVTFTVTYRPLVDPGDVDGDGHITANDALAVLRYALGIISTLDDSIAADVDGDGRITANDALMILRYALGIINEFPVD